MTFLVGLPSVLGCDLLPPPPGTVPPLEETEQALVDLRQQRQFVANNLNTFREGGERLEALVAELESALAPADLDQVARLLDAATVAPRRGGRVNVRSRAGGDLHERLEDLPIVLGIEAIAGEPGDWRLSLEDRSETVRLAVARVDPTSLYFEPPDQSDLSRHPGHDDRWRRIRRAEVEVRQLDQIIGTPPVHEGAPLAAALGAARLRLESQRRDDLARLVSTGSP